MNKKTKVKNENHITIKGYMINEFNLKGNELLIYAIIEGYSQTENTYFTGSLQYLADWTNSTKQGVIKNLKSLKEKGLIKAIEEYKNGVKYVKYYSTKFNGGIKQSLMGYSTEFNGGIKQSLPNNITDNIANTITDNIVIGKKQKRFTLPTVEEVKAYCIERQNSVDPQKFFDYYDASNWIDAKGQKVKNWKQKVITWERNNTDKPQKKVGANGVELDNRETDILDDIF